MAFFRMTDLPQYHFYSMNTLSYKVKMILHTLLLVLLYIIEVIADWAGKDCRNLKYSGGQGESYK
jgi:hypothetical protein